MKTVKNATKGFVGLVEFFICIFTFIFITVFNGFFPGL